MNQMEDRVDPVGPEAREPAFNAPWPALALPAALVAFFLVQPLAGEGEAALAAFGFAPAALEAGRPLGLLTALFVHGGWTHVILNALGALAFGAPVARALGTDGRGAAAFAVMFLVCGVGASLAFALAHPGSEAVLVGASGAVAGFMGAASRLMERGPGLAPFTSRTVMGMAAGWVIVNLIVAVVGLGAVSGDAPIAWEAHLAGYAIGLVLFEPLLRVTGRIIKA